VFEEGAIVHSGIMRGAAAATHHKPPDECNPPGHRSAI
jgi:hypothetical protein